MFLEYFFSFLNTVFNTIAIIFFLIECENNLFIYSFFNLFISVLYKSNFLTSVMVEFSMVEFSVVEFTYGGIFHGGIFRGGIYLRWNFPWWNFPWGNLPRTGGSAGRVTR